MIAKFRTNVRSVLVFMGLCFSASGYCADKNNCFTSVEQYAVRKFGGDFGEDENIVISVRDFGKTTFHVVEDKTSGTNHLRILLQYRSQEGFCAVLETPPVAELRVLNVDAAGFPVKLMATDQAPPGLPENEITYVFNPLDATYQMSKCRKIDRGARKVRARTVDCNKVFE